MSIHQSNFTYFNQLVNKGYFLVKVNLMSRPNFVFCKVEVGTTSSSIAASLREVKLLAVRPTSALNTGSYFKAC
jgi:hypothetical protein